MWFPFAKPKSCKNAICPAEPRNADAEMQKNTGNVLPNHILHENIDKPLKQTREDHLSISILPVFFINFYMQ